MRLEWNHNPIAQRQAGNLEHIIERTASRLNICHQTAQANRVANQGLSNYFSSSFGGFSRSDDRLKRRLEAIRSVSTGQASAGYTAQRFRIQSTGIDPQRVDVRLGAGTYLSPQGVQTPLLGLGGGRQRYFDSPKQSRLPECFSGGFRFLPSATLTVKPNYHQHTIKWAAYQALI